MGVAVVVVGVMDGGGYIITIIIINIILKT